MNFDHLLSRFDPETGEIHGMDAMKRYLSDMRGCFADSAAYEAALAKTNPVLYTVANVDHGSAEGDLNYALGLIMPGRIGAEYYMTKGHLHAWRPAGEIYLGLSGEGLMLLEAESTDETRSLPLWPNQVVYVPGHTAHRTVNTGITPLTYLGIYPAKAGHDYLAIAEQNFRQVVVERNGGPVVIQRSEFQATGLREP